jgi:hypothetical protein
MTDLSRISDDELLFDRQESFNDLVACLVASWLGATHYKGGTEPVRGRIDGNLGIIQAIEAECKRRGFDPAMYRVKEVKA